MNLLHEILSFPPIIQGVIGSAIFWVLLFLGQKLYNSIVNRAKRTSQNLSNQRVVADVMLEIVMVGKEPAKTSAAGVWCLLHSLKQVIKAAIFLVMGIALSIYSNIFLAVGAFGSLVFLFSALNFSNIGWRKSSIDGEK
jgi:hypothetical protein